MLEHQEPASSLERRRPPIAVVCSSPDPFMAGNIMGKIGNKNFQVLLEWNTERRAPSDPSELAIDHDFRGRFGEGCWGNEPRN